MKNLENKKNNKNKKHNNIKYNGKTFISFHIQK